MTYQQKLQAARREKLKNAILSHPQHMNMAYFYLDRKKPRTGMISNNIPNTISKLANECGTTCCIAGFAHILWPKLAAEGYKFDQNHLTRIADWLGVKKLTDWSYRVDVSSLFWLMLWPNDLYRKYSDARDEGDHIATAKCAAEMIDRMAV